MMVFSLFNCPMPILLFLQQCEFHHGRRDICDRQQRQFAYKLPPISKQHQIHQGKKEASAYNQLKNGNALERASDAVKITDALPAVHLHRIRRPL
jgi:hypothetical protein